MKLLLLVFPHTLLYTTSLHVVSTDPCLVTLQCTETIDPHHEQQQPAPLPVGQPATFGQSLKFVRRGMPAQSDIMLTPPAPLSQQYFIAGVGVSLGFMLISVILGGIGVSEVRACQSTLLPRSDTPRVCALAAVRRRRRYPAR